ncbi:ABC transporter permease [Bifidobacterium thermacidophilum]|uniref:ABC transporter permease n=1 Tax=Bifidobacterium thermacidophilum TaxID=246618 RepID=A0ABW8KQX0_9BIFI
MSEVSIAQASSVSFTQENEAQTEHAGSSRSGLLARIVNKIVVPVKKARLRVVLASLYLALVLLMVIAPGLFTKQDPVENNLLAVNLPPSAAHLAGTDYLGRDLFARIVYGARYSVGIGLAVTAFALFFALILGTLSGVSRSAWVDNIVMRIVDILSSFPSILLALIIVAFTGSGIQNLILALGIGSIPGLTRLIRAETKKVILSEYVQQSKTFGLSRFTILIRHVLPNALGVIPYMVTMRVGEAIIGVSGLSYLGVGPQPPTPEWGTIIADSRNYLGIAWWSGIIPGVVLVLTVISCTVIGQAWQRSFEGRN